MVHNSIVVILNEVFLLAGNHVDKHYHNTQKQSITKSSELKSILSSYSLTNSNDALQKATDVYNNASHSYLMGRAPDDVKCSNKGSKLLQYEIDKMSGEQTRTNNLKWQLE